MSVFTEQKIICKQRKNTENRLSIDFITIYFHSIIDGLKLMFDTRVEYRVILIIRLAGISLYVHINEVAILGDGYRTGFRERYVAIHDEFRLKRIM